MADRDSVWKEVGALRSPDAKFCARHEIIASRGKPRVGGDLSNVSGRGDFVQFRGKAYRGPGNPGTVSTAKRSTTELEPTATVNRVYRDTSYRKFLSSVGLFQTAITTITGVRVSSCVRAQEESSMGKRGTNVRRKGDDGRK